MVRWLLMQVITQASQSQNKLCMRQFVCVESCMEKSPIVTNKKVV